jgi:predicted HicB family RNase H-like nuclease
MRGGSRSGAGRPPEKNPRTATLRVRLTQREHKALTKAAERAGCTITTWARRALGFEIEEESK